MQTSPQRVLLLLLVVLSSLGRAHCLDPTTRLSQYGHTAWRSADGVFDAEPNAVAQTKDGYLWVGTTSTLLRFDGVRFLPWEGANGVKLPSTFIRSLFASRDGSLWIGTSRGLSLFKEGVLTNLESSYGAIWDIVEDDAGTIWVARANIVAGGQPLCKVEGNALHCFGTADGVPFPYAQTLACDHRGNVWVGSSTEYLRWSPTSQTSYTPSAIKNLADLGGIPSIVLEPNGNPLIGFLNAGPGLGLEEMVDGSPRPYPARDFDTTQFSVQTLYFDHRGVLWIGTESGIYRESAGAVDHLQQSDGLSGNSIHGFFEDAEGDLWVVTSGGIDRLRDLPIRSFGSREGLSSNAAKSLLTARDGSLWITQAETMDVLKSGSTFSVHLQQLLNGTHFPGMAIQDHTGAFWVAMDNGLLRHDKGASQMISRPAGSPTDTKVQALAEDSQGDVWAVFNPKPELWKVHNGKAVRITEPAIPRTFSMAADHHGGLWLGFISGDLGHLVDGKLETVSLPHAARGASLVRELGVTSSDEVIGTTPVGLVYVDKGKKQVMSVKNGLPCNNLFAFVFDHSGDLWISSTCGTMHINKADWSRWRHDAGVAVTPQVFDALDGAQYTGNQLEPSDSAVTPDGRVWFANGRSVQMLDPAALANNRTVPPVHVEDITADGTVMASADQLRLPALTRQIQFDYTALSLPLPQKVLFRYKLANHDKDWQEAGPRRQAFYNDLKPGKYRFQVIACNNSGLWNTTGASVEFEVAPAWFQTEWFLILCITAALLLTYGAYRLRVKQVQGVLRMRYDAQLAERTRLARDLHDTLLQTIQGSQIIAEVALQDQSDPIKMHGALEKIASWLDRAVVEGRAAVTSLRNYSDGGTLPDRLRRAAEECSRDRGMALQFKVAGKAVDLEPEASEEVYKIGYEAIRNACAHSKGDLLEVELDFHKGLILRVKDNGVGFPPETANSGTPGHFGIPGMRERAERLGATVRVISTPGIGTELILEARSLEGLAI